MAFVAPGLGLGALQKFPIDFKIFQWKCPLQNEKCHCPFNMFKNEIWGLLQFGIYLKNVYRREWIQTKSRVSRFHRPKSHGGKLKPKQQKRLAQQIFTLHFQVVYLTVCNIHKECILSEMDSRFVPNSLGKRPWNQRTRKENQKIQKWFNEHWQDVPHLGIT